MNIQVARRILPIVFVVSAAGALAAVLGGLTVATPTATAQVGVPYTSSCATTSGTPPYTYSISVGALPPGLNIGSANGAITGTPTTSGVFSFTCFVADSTASLPTVAGPASANRRVIAQSGTPALSGSGAFSITVAPAAPSPTPVPPSIWMAAMGLAGAGLFRMRQLRRA